MLPAEALDEAFADLQAAGICHAVALGAGFAETGDDGRLRQQAVWDCPR